MTKAIFIQADTLPEAWESAVIDTWRTGEEASTEYDKPEDPRSRDVTAMIAVNNPFAELRIHKAFPGGLEDLEKYRQEVLYGVHDHWVDPAAGKWEYTYHQRVRAYDVPGIGIFDQVAGAIKKLKEAPHTRRAQAVTWKVWEDMNINDPSCLQRLWFRISNNKLHMNAHMRSNDAFKAAFMNMYAFTELQKQMAGELGVGVGTYVHIADSFHIYGSYFDEFKGFLELTGKRSNLEDRVFRTNDKMVVDCFDDGRLALLNEFLDRPEMRLPLNHQIRIYQELPENLRGQVDPRVLEVVRRG